MDAELATLTAVGFASWAIVRGGRSWVARRERRAACQHDLRLDDQGATFEYAVLRCAHGCGHQEPARAYIATKRRERDERIRADLIARCPRCGEEVPPGA